MEELGVEPAPDTIALMRRIRYTPTPNHNLPTNRTPLLGRETELVQLKSLLHDPAVRLVTLVGVGGMGKTRLALEIAGILRQNFIEGVWLVELAGIDDPNHLPLAIATTLNFNPDVAAPVKPQLLNFLKEKELLLFLDNFEQFGTQSGLLAEILQQAPHVKILVTSRHQLRLRGEHLLAVDGLPLDQADNPAVQLFEQVIRQHQPHFDRQKNLPEMMTICRLVHGSPLAIELAAASAHFLPCAYIAEAIQENLDILQTEMQDVPERHRSVRAVFNHSWERLSPKEQTAFAQLAIFRGGFTFEAATKSGGCVPACFGAIGEQIAGDIAPRPIGMNAMNCCANTPMRS